MALGDVPMKALRHGAGQIVSGLGSFVLSVFTFLLAFVVGGDVGLLLLLLTALLVFGGIVGVVWGLIVLVFGGVTGVAKVGADAASAASGDGDEETEASGFDEYHEP